MFEFTKKVLIGSLLFTSALNAGNKEVSKNEIAQMEQLELLKRAQIKITKAYDIGSLYILNINVQGNAEIGRA
ncbi:MAG: DsbC family protein, partial [Aliarcobacter sp.]|nr:DsbC family protein [Aliarcobacter sp.]